MGRRPGKRRINHPCLRFESRLDQSVLGIEGLGHFQCRASAAPETICRHRTSDTWEEVRHLNKGRFGKPIERALDSVNALKFIESTAGKRKALNTSNDK